MVAPAVDLTRFRNADAIERLTGQVKRDHRLMHVDLDPDGTYHVLSWSRPGVVYDVIGDACHCEAAQHGLACWHVVAADLDRRERRDALMRQDRDAEAAHLSYMLFGD